MATSMTDEDNDDGPLVIPIDLMDTYADFVLNIKVLGSIGGAGVPTLPIRVPQIIEYDSQKRKQCISYSKLVDIIIMISSSQDSFSTTSTTSTSTDHPITKSNNKKKKFTVTLTFSDPPQNDIVMVESGDDLLQIMEQYQSQRQLTLVAHVEQQSSGMDDDSLPTHHEPPPLSHNNYNNNHHSNKDPPKLDFSAPNFTCSVDDPATNVMVHLMEQLLQVQSSRMQQFADHMEDRFSHLIEERIVSSEVNMKQCLQETVQLMDHTNDNNNNNNSNKQASVHHRLDHLETRMDQRLENMEQLMLMVRQDAETTKNATIAALNSPAGKARHVSPPSSTRSTNSKPPLPPQQLQQQQQQRSAEPPEPPILEPRLDASLPPVSPSVLSTPLPPSPRSQSPHLPPHRTEERPSLSGPPPALAPMSPPNSEHNTERTSSEDNDDYDVDDGDYDEDDDDDEAPLSPTPPPERMSSLSMPSLASVKTRDLADDEDDDDDDDLDDAPTTPPTNVAALPSSSGSSESKMKQAIKDHMESMESRVSKLRELNNQSSATTPSTAPNTATPGTHATNSSSAMARALFPPDTVPSEDWESKFATKLDELGTSLRSTMQDATRDTVDHKLADLEKLLESKLEQIEKVVTTNKQSSSSVQQQRQQPHVDAPPTSPRRRESSSEGMALLQELIERRMDNLESVLQQQSSKDAPNENLDAKIVSQIREALEDVMSSAQRNGKEIGGSTGSEDTALFTKLTSLLEKRMDSVEALVEDTAKELETNTKTIQVRLQQALMDQILDALDPIMDKILGESKGEISMATSVYASVYGDDPSEVTIDHTAEMRSAHATNPRSYEALPHVDDLVIADREASVRKVYGDMEIDDEEEQAQYHKPRGKLDTMIGRGKSLRDLCDIDTIEEEEEDEWSSYDRSSYTKKSGDDSVARSESARNIYGDAIDIDDKNGGATRDAPPTPVQRKATDEEFDTPITQNRTFYGEPAIDEGEDEDEKHNSSFVYGDDDDSTDDLGEKEPSKASDDNAVYNDIDIDEQDDNQKSLNSSAVYGDVDIDDQEEKKNKTLNLGRLDKEKQQSFNASLPSMAEYSAQSLSTAESLVDNTNDRGDPHSEDFDYDDIGIDAGIDDGKEEATIASADELYDDLSLDGVDYSKEVDLEGDDSEDLDWNSDSSESSSDSESAASEDSYDRESLDESDYDSSGYDSESSKEDEEYFHDHARQHLAVLASAMTRIRQAQKGTNRYSRFQEALFTARRQGPLSVRTQNVSDYDANDESGNQMKMSDNSSESSRGDRDDYESSIEEQRQRGDDYDEDDSTGTGDLSRESSRLREYHERSKESARIVCKAIAKYRVTKRAAKDYRRVLLAKFTAKRRGPLTLSSPDDEEDQSSANGSSASDNSYDDNRNTDGANQPSNREAEQYSDEEYSSSEMSQDENADSDHAPHRIAHTGPVAQDEPVVSDPPRVEGEIIDPAVLGYDVPDESAHDNYEAPQNDDVDDAAFGYDDSEEYSDEDIDYAQNADKISNEDEGGDDMPHLKPMKGVVKRVDGPVADPNYGSDDRESNSDAGDDAENVIRIPVHSTYVEVQDSLFRRVDMSPEEVYEAEEIAKTEAAARFVQGSGYVEIPSEDGKYSLFRRLDVEARRSKQDASEHSVSEQGPAAPGESTSKTAYARSIDEDESLNLGSAASSAGGIQGRAVQAVFDDDGDVIERDEVEQRNATNTLVRAQGLAPTDDASPEEVWKSISEHSQREQDDILLGEGSASDRDTTGVSDSPNPSDETGGMRAAEASPGPGNMSPEEIEMHEWEKVESKPSPPKDQGESKTSDHDTVERVLLLDHIHDIKTQIQQWEEKFLTSNDTLRTSVHESIDDSHHFAAYLDKMLTERIGQLEEAIRAQTFQNSVEVAASSQFESLASAASAPPSGVRSAPTTPMRGSIDDLTADGESKEHSTSDEVSNSNVHGLVSSMMVNVEEWKRLQDKLRGTEEVAEGYRKQVLQLRNVLEVKINEGNASLHQVELLQRKLQEAHDREIQAQKQLRPVTRRVEQVIEEMVELEERSANLQMENGRLRDLLWMSERTV